MYYCIPLAYCAEQFPCNLVIWREHSMKNCIVTLIIAAVIGVPVTLLVMASSFWLSHGAGSIGFIVTIIAVPGLLTESSWGIVGVVIVQIAYYIFIAVGLKALFRHYFFEQTKNLS